MSDAEARSTTVPATSGDQDWPTTLTATLVGYVDTVKGATTGKALVASRMGVYFFPIALIAMVLAIVLLILVVRLLVVVTGYLPFVDEGNPWLAYLVLGSLFSAVGGLLWRKKDA
ncbi:MAG: hypothetical protein R2733_09385 [Acidimicrobiales bacterium]